MISVNKSFVLWLGFHAPPEPRPRAIMLGKLLPACIRDGQNAALVRYKGDRWNIDIPQHEIIPYKLQGILTSIPLLRDYAEYQYYKRTVRSIALFIKQLNINCIFAFAKPNQANIIGALLKIQLNIPLVAHFSDPWYDNPYETRSWWGKQKTKWMEYFVIKTCDRVVFVNDELRELVMKKYPSIWWSKALTIPHAFDINEYPNAQKRRHETFTISHIGAFYKQRSPETLFKVIKIIKESNPKLTKSIKIQLIGGISGYTDYTERALIQLIDRYELQSIVNIIPPVTYQESLRYMKEADCLIVIDAPIEDSPFLPSKVVDYAGSGTQIVGITPQGSPTAKFLKNLNYISFTHDEVEPCAKFLTQLINGNLIMEQNNAVLATYSIDAIAKKYNALFNELSTNS